MTLIHNFISLGTRVEMTMTRTTTSMMRHMIPIKTKSVALPSNMVKTLTQ